MKQAIDKNGKKVEVPLDTPTSYKNGVAYLLSNEELKAIEEAKKNAPIELLENTRTRKKQEVENEKKKRIESAKDRDEYMQEIVAVIEEIIDQANIKPNNIINALFAIRDSKGNIKNKATDISNSIDTLSQEELDKLDLTNDAIWQ
jgi:hypothetical protein